MPSYRVPNYFQAQTPIGEGIQSLAGALFSGPGPLEMEQDRLKNQYMTAQTAHAQTQAELGRAKLGAGGKISDFLKLATAPIVEGQNRADLIRGGMAGLGQGLSDGGEIGQLAQVIRATMANSGASDNDVIRAQAGAGGTIGVNDAVSLAGQNAVAGRNQRDLMQKTQYQEGQQTARNSADISAANARNAANNSAAMAREQWHLLNSPVNTGAGDTTTFAPNDPRGKNGPIVGQATESTAKGAAFKMLTPEQQAATVNGSFDKEDKLRRDFEAGIKDFDTAQRSFNSMGGLAKDDTGGSDIALINAFYKTLMPQSTVLQGEFDQAANSLGLGEGVVRLMMQAKGGQKLLPNQRQELINAAGKFFEQSKSDLAANQQLYTDRSNRYGLDARNVVRSPLREQASTTQAPPAQQPPPVQQPPKPRRTATNPATGQKLVYDETTRQWTPE